MDTISKIWNDPVLSKVISVFIIAAITTLYQYFNKKAKSKGFWGSVISLWTLKFELWIATLVFIIIYFLDIEFPGYSSWSIVLWVVLLLVTASIRNALQPNNPTASEYREVEYFNSTTAKKFDFAASEEHTWINDKREGELARGNFDFSDALINIERSNTDGRYVIAISKYLASGKRVGYIPKDISHGSKRIINIRFQAKIIGGFHYLLFVAKEVDSYQWIHNANTRVKIDSPEWKDFEVQIRVPSEKDFRIDLDDREIQKPGTSLQIKDLVIGEVF